MSKWLNSHQRWGSFILRLALGLSLTVHGYEKLFPHGALHAFEHFVATLGLPRPLGIISAYTEFIGGILLLLGLFTRLAAALVAINMLVAFFTVGIHEGFGIYNYILALAAIAIMLMLTGAGALGLDRKIGFS